jgi:hypothetical protein
MLTVGKPDPAKERSKPERVAVDIPPDSRCERHGLKQKAPELVMNRKGEIVAKSASDYPFKLSASREALEEGLISETEYQKECASMDWLN